MKLIYVVTTLLIAVLIGGVQPCFSQNKVEKQYSFTLQSNHLKQALKQITNETGYQFSYREQLIKEVKVKKYTFKKKTISQILQRLFTFKPLTFQIKGTVIILQKRKLKKYTISGVISESESGETLIGATLLCKNEQKGVTTNQFGFYSLTLPEGEYTLIARYLGLKPIHQNVVLNKNMRLDLTLLPIATVLKEVVISGKKGNDNIKAVKMSMESMDIATIHSMPALLGEADVMKSLQMLPGVQSSTDASANLNVRGGGYDQNLILLDDAPIYNPSHALGFFSVFNPYAVKNVEIYKGGIPAQYGERLSSVVDIRTKDGDMQNFHGNASIGTIASRLSVEGPIIKDKASFILSGRYSYAGFMADNFAKLGENIGFLKSALQDYRSGNDVSFYDLNLKMNYKIDANNRLYFSGYLGRDQFYYRLIDEKSSMNWGNNSASLRWNHIFNTQLFANTTLVYSSFDYAYYLKDDIRNFKWSSKLKEFEVKTDVDYYLSPNNKMKFGLTANMHQIAPGQIEPNSSTSITKPYTMDENLVVGGGAYFSHEFKIGSKLSLLYGLRYSAFANMSEGTVNTYTDASRTEVSSTKNYEKGEVQAFYQALDPRLNLCCSLDETQSIKASYARTHQYLHLLSATSNGLPTDVWHPSNQHLKPQTSNQYALGYFKNFHNNIWKLSLEAYYKEMTNQLDFKDNAQLFLNTKVEQEILSGKGWAYGAEFMLKKDEGRWKGWLSYTWSKTERKIEGINQGRRYPTRFDKRHDVSLYLDYRLNDKISFSANFVYATGGAITVPKGGFDYQGTVFNYYTERNDYRLPAYHRLDLAMTLKGHQGKRYKTEWVFALYNAYNRHNAYSVYTKQDEYNLRATKGNMVYMFGLVPSVSFNLKF